MSRDSTSFSALLLYYIINIPIGSAGLSVLSFPAGTASVESRNTKCIMRMNVCNF